MKIKILIAFLFIFVVTGAKFAFADNFDSLSPKDQVKQLKNENQTLELDRNNLLKQAKAIQKEKEALLRKFAEIKDVRSDAEVESESLRKENEILLSEVEKLKAAREKDRALHVDEKQTLQGQIEDQMARADSLVALMEEYTPERVEDLVADRNRLQQENQRMAQKVFEYEKRLEDMRKQLTPLELDREELHRLRAETKDLYKKVQYIQKLEKRQEELIRENKQYREEAEVLKGKLKETAPGLAKAGRISQKMMRENADMHYNLGTIFLQNKKYKEALQEYERVLELRPSDPETHYNLGVLYDDYIKDREKALYHYQKYLAINPKSPDAKKVESYVLSLELQQKVR